MGICLVEEAILEGSPSAAGKAEALQGAGRSLPQPASLAGCPAAKGPAGDLQGQQQASRGATSWVWGSRGAQSLP